MSSSTSLRTNLADAVGRERRRGSNRDRQLDLMREVREMASDFRWYDNNRMIEDVDMEFLDRETQKRNQESFTRKNIRVFGGGKDRAKADAIEFREEKVTESRLEDEEEEDDEEIEEEEAEDEEEEEEIQEIANEDEDKDEEVEENDENSIHLAKKHLSSSGNQPITQNIYSKTSQYPQQSTRRKKIPKLKTKTKNSTPVLKEFTNIITYILRSNLFLLICRVILLVAVIIVLAGAIVRTNNSSKIHDTARPHYNTQYIPVESLTEVNSKLRKFQMQLEQLSETQDALTTDNGKVLEDFQRVQLSFNRNWDLLNRKFTSLQSQVSGKLDSHALNKQFEQMETKLKLFDETLKRGKDIDVDHSRHLSEIFEQMTDFESNLSKLEFQMEEFSKFQVKIDSIFGSLKDDVLQSVLDRLPAMIPIVNNSEGQLQMSPEVYDYLSEVISNTVNKKLSSIDLQQTDQELDLSWDGFLSKNGIEINQYLTQFINDELKLVKKLDFEQVLLEAFKSNKAKLDRDLSKIRSLLDQQVNELDSKISRIAHTSALNSDDDSYASATSRLLIEHLISKKIDENLMRIEGRANYADFEQGLKVISKLTSKSIISQLRRRKNIWQRALFGWYDLLKRVAFANDKKSSGKISNGNLIDNPENAISDNKSYWVALKEDCHIGIRLSRAICLIEILFKHPRNDNPLILTSAPKKISVYVKPQDKKNQAKLREVFGDFHNQDFIPALKGFAKITEFEYDINDPHIYQFVQLPKKFLLLQIPVSEVYFEIESNWGHEQITSLHNVKVFGINEQDIEKAKKFLKLDQDASNLQVIDELREKFVEKATYNVEHEEEFI